VTFSWASTLFLTEDMPLSRCVVPTPMHMSGFRPTHPKTARPYTAPNRTLIVSALSVGSWRDRAGRRIVSNYTAMERSTSQSGGRFTFTAVDLNAQKLEEADIGARTCRDPLRS
jgi:hypothetical protein